MKSIASQGGIVLVVLAFVSVTVVLHKGHCIKISYGVLFYVWSNFVALESYSKVKIKTSGEWQSMYYMDFSFCNKNKGMHGQSSKKAWVWSSPFTSLTSIFLFIITSLHLSIKFPHSLLLFYFFLSSISYTCFFYLWRGWIITITTPIHKSSSYLSFFVFSRWSFFYYLCVHSTTRFVSFVNRT